MDEPSRVRPEALAYLLHVDTPEVALALKGLTVSIPLRNVAEARAVAGEKAYV